MNGAAAIQIRSRAPPTLTIPPRSWAGNRRSRTRSTGIRSQYQGFSTAFTQPCQTLDRRSPTFSNESSPVSQSGCVMMATTSAVASHAGEAQSDEPAACAAGANRARWSMTIVS